MPGPPSDEVLPLVDLPSEETADLLREPPRRDAAGGRGEDGVVAGERAQALRHAPVVDGQGHGGGHPGPRPYHDQRLVVAQGQDGLTQLGQLRGCGGIHRLPLVDGAPGTRHAQPPQLGEVARERGLRRLDALDGEQFRQLLLGGDAARAPETADLPVPLLLAALFTHQPHARIQEPTPLSVNNSPMIECGTRPSSRWTLGTPEASTRRMLFAFAFMPPAMVPSSINFLRSALVSWPISSPALRSPGTAEAEMSFWAPMATASSAATLSALML